MKIYRKNPVCTWLLWKTVFKMVFNHPSLLPYFIYILPLHPSISTATVFVDCFFCRLLRSVPSRQFIGFSQAAKANLSWRERVPSWLSATSLARPTCNIRKFQGGFATPLKLTVCPLKNAWWFWRLGIPIWEGLFLGDRFILGRVSFLC